MVRSMTGYGRSVLQLESTVVTIEIKSVNHRFLDVQLKIPQTFLFLEEKLKETIRTYFARGRIELILNIGGTGAIGKTLETDWKLLDQYMEQLKQIKTRYQLSDEIPMSLLLSIPELFSVQQTTENSSLLLEKIETCTEKACLELLAMREAEGEKLFADIMERMHGVKELVGSLQTRRGRVTDAYRERIQQRIEAYINNKIETDNSRMYQEIALLAEKGDITEEVTRLFSHMNHFFTTIERETEIGRRLDFILQEMQRETNTIGAKSTDPKISEWVVSIKSELEKMKEQIQNIE
ncbi:YicC/YloC family endoribonuclease [Lentibacillus sp. N15]|uniref:YicC/YloC family endoribonuclease n=1 Tax=Lentibacillus songyuanensis TaxID=3136161 RepID=UPI0031B9F4B6